jgi:hypothetical protein
MATTKREVKTPGEDPQATTGAAPTEETGSTEGSTEGSGTETTKASGTPSVADLLAIIEQQAAQVANLTAAMQNISRAQTPAARVTEELPDIDSLDKASIKTPLLTKSGWYVPETFGSNPNAAR